MAIRKDYKRLEVPAPSEPVERVFLTPPERHKVRELKRRRVALQKELDSLSDRGLADRFGVSKSTIQRIW